jgi:hypothetical protein
MGSKHNPPKWWIDYDQECAAFAARKRSTVPDWVQNPDPPDFLGKDVPFSATGAQTNWAVHTTRSAGANSKTEKAVGWTCYEEVGAQCLTLDGQPITPNMTVGKGMEILVPHLFCIINVPETYVRATIQDEASAYSDDSVWFLAHDPVRGLVSWGGGNLKAIEKLKFAGDL